MGDFTNFNPSQIVWDDGLGAVAVEELGPTEWRLLHPFTYKTLAGKEIIVPAGFITDGASSPLRELITSWGGHYSSAALIHDYLYTQLNHGNPDPAAPTRADADGILYEAMKRCGVNFWVRWAMWLAVRGFGGPGMRDLGVR